MNQEEANLALTDAARRIAQQKDVPFKRRVRYVEGLDHDIVVRREEATILLSKSIPTGRAIAALEDAILQAARLDFDWRSAEELARAEKRAEQALHQVCYKLAQAAVEGRYNKAQQMLTGVSHCVNHLQSVREEEAV